MSMQMKSDKTLRLGLGFMVLLVLVLGLRSGKTVSTVLAMDHAVQAEPVQTPTDDIDLAQIDARDRRIAEATPVDHDPFRRPGAPQAPRERRSRAPREIVAPSLGALLYDNVNPSAQISIQGERSDWLRQGDEFKGWTVRSITPQSVTITNGRETVVLS